MSNEALQTINELRARVALLETCVKLLYPNWKKPPQFPCFSCKGEGWYDPRKSPWAVMWGEKRESVECQACLPGRMARKLLCSK